MPALRSDALWLAAVALGTIGTALVFVGVTVSGLVLPGVVLIDVALLVAAAAGAWQLRTAGSTVEEDRHAG